MKTPREIFEEMIERTKFTGQRYAVVKIDDLRQLLDIIDVQENRLAEAKDLESRLRFPDTTGK